jgi:hypothetical protein
VFSERGTKGERKIIKSSSNCCFDTVATTEGDGQGVAPLVGLLVLLGGGSSKTESGSNGGAPFGWFSKSV